MIEEWKMSSKRRRARALRLEAESARGISSHLAACASRLCFALRDASRSGAPAHPRACVAWTQAHPEALAVSARPRGGLPARPTGKVGPEEQQGYYHLHRCRARGPSLRNPTPGAAHPQFALSLCRPGTRYRARLGPNSVPESALQSFRVAPAVAAAVRVGALAGSEF